VSVRIIGIRSALNFQSRFDRCEIGSGQLRPPNSVVHNVARSRNFDPDLKEDQPISEQKMSMRFEPFEIL
jgi:hypothetical protein